MTGDKNKDKLAILGKVWYDINVGLYITVEEADGNAPLRDSETI